MTRKFLDYTKSVRLEATEPEVADRREAKPERMEIRMTRDGFPIIPKLVMEKEMKKTEWEKLLRPFLTQHYCALTSYFIGLSLMRFSRSCQWKEVKTGALQCNKDGYRKLHTRSVPTAWNEITRPKKYAAG